jgi:hypothetical protein
MPDRIIRRAYVEDGTCIMVRNGLYMGTIQNISIGGLFVTSSINLKPMDRIDVSIILSSDTGDIEIDADVVATRVENRGIALKYYNMDQKELRLLRSYLHKTN